MSEGETSFEMILGFVGLEDFERGPALARCVRRRASAVAGLLVAWLVSGGGATIKRTGRGFQVAPASTRLIDLVRRRGKKNTVVARHASEGVQVHTGQPARAHRRPGFPSITAVKNAARFTLLGLNCQ